MKNTHKHIRKFEIFILKKLKKKERKIFKNDMLATTCMNKKNKKKNL